MSLGVLQALHERGSTRPDDVSIVGFDDMPWQVAMQPPLTCIAQPTYDIGATAARLLLERIAEPQPPGAARRPRNRAGGSRARPALPRVDAEPHARRLLPLVPVPPARVACIGARGQRRPAPSSRW